MQDETVHDNGNQRNSKEKANSNCSNGYIIISSDVSEIAEDRNVDNTDNRQNLRRSYIGDILITGEPTRDHEPSKESHAASTYKPEPKRQVRTVLYKNCRN